jgi:hypothetical protein
MSKKTAQIIFIIFNVLAVFAVLYAVNDYMYIVSSVESSTEEISFDSGTYYFFLMSVFWVFSLIQYAGSRKTHSKILKYANQLVVIWFVFVLILANVIPYYLNDKLERAGYIKCEDLEELSRIGKGESSIYFRDGF